MQRLFTLLSASTKGFENIQWLFSPERLEYTCQGHHYVLNLVANRYWLYRNNEPVGRFENVQDAADFILI